MLTKLESARQKAEELIKKDDERIQLELTVKKIQERTDPEGMLSISLDDKTIIRVPALVILGVFSDATTAVVAELDVLADAINVK